MKHVPVHMLGALAAAGLIAVSLGCSRTPSPLCPGHHGSVGLPYRGVLTNPVPLPKSGPGYVRIKRNGNHYGTPALVEAIEYATAHVQREIPGPPIHVGDLSGRRGGKIPNHNSHRSGRDADFIFYATDLGGARIASPGWTNYGPDGIGVAHRSKHGRIYVRFDVERNWQLVKALLRAPSADIMWLFMSNPLKALLTEYAIARGEEPTLVWHAENVMHQPRNALPHDDHFHVRIMCPSGSGVNGCEQGGPTWPWLAPSPGLAWPESDEEIASFLDVDSTPPL